MKLSHSSISMYEECPAKYKYRYIERIPTKPKHYFAFGNSVHSALEFMFAGDELPSLEAVMKEYERGWISVGYKDEKAEDKAKRDGEKMIHAMYANQTPPYVKPLYVEMGFNISVDWVKVTGKIDRIDIVHGDDDNSRRGLHVIDYKTGKPIEVGRALDDPQLTMYQLAVEELGLGRVVALSLYHVPSLTPEGTGRHSDSLVVALRRKIVRVAEGIAQKEFPEKPSENSCRMCDYKNVCPVWRLAPTES